MMRSEEFYIPNISDSEKRKQIANLFRQDNVDRRDKMVQELSKQELPKTPEEMEMALSIIDVFTRMVKQLTSRDVYFFVPNIHILDPQGSLFREVAQKKMESLGEGMLGGWEKDGHVFIPKSDIVQFGWMLPHEMSHAVDFAAEAVYLKNGVAYAKQRRAGVHFYPGVRTGEEVASKEKDQFFGYNEGRAEIIAYAVRQNLLQEYSDLIPENKREDFKSNTLYFWQVRIVTRAVSELQKFGFSLNECWKMLVGDGLDGTYHFLKQLEKLHKGAVKIIAMVGGDEESAQAAFAELEVLYAKEKR